MPKSYWKNFSQLLKYDLNNSLTTKNMKKTTITLIFALLASSPLTGCSKYTVDKPELTPEKIQQYEQAIEENQEKLKNTKITEIEKTESLQSIGISYERLGKYDDAINYYEQILKIAPTNFLALNNLAAIYEEVEEYDSAQKYIETLYQYYGKDTRTNQGVITDIIRILVKNKKFDQARQVLEDYARDNQSLETGPFVSDQFEYIERMKEAENNK